MFFCKYTCFLHWFRKYGLLWLSYGVYNVLCLFHVVFDFVAMGSCWRNMYTCRMLYFGSEYSLLSFEEILIFFSIAWLKIKNDPVSHSPFPIFPAIIQSWSELESMELTDIIPSDWILQEPSCPSHSDTTVPQNMHTVEQQHHYPTNEDEFVSNRLSMKAQSQGFSFVKT